MDHDTIFAWAQKIVSGKVTPHEFLRKLRDPPATAPLPDAVVDIDRADRCGFPEVVFGEGKSVETLTRIFRALLQAQQPVLATRIDAELAAGLNQNFPSGSYNHMARTYRVAVRVAELDEATAASSLTNQRAPVTIVTAGTTDLPVAEEARETVDWMGLPTLMIHDVGVAGPHRLPAHLDKLRAAAAIVVVAGMEGALPSVVGGYVAVPVIAVPTSVGYGTAFGGVTALLGMLNSCAANVAVVNIDAGFKAGYLAGLIAIRDTKPDAKLGDECHG